MNVLVLALAALVSAPLTPPPLDRSVPLHPHWTIAHARAVLVREGWKPVRPPHPVALDHRYPELESCAAGANLPGQNLVFCLFDYIKGGRCLQVETVGEFTMRVEWWTHDCPSN